MTSNVGSHIISKGANATIGFALEDASGEDPGYSRLRSLVLEELKSTFRPELLNRMDEIVVFHHLAREHVERITDLHVAATRERLAERGISLELSEAVTAKLVAEGYDPEYGARPVRRAVARVLEDVISDSVLTGSLRGGDVARLDVHGDTGEVYVRVVRPEAVVEDSAYDHLLPISSVDDWEEVTQLS